MRAVWVPLVVVSLLGLASWGAAGPATCPLGVPVMRLGVQGAASGAHADYGRQIEMGAQLAIEEINAAGGILGCRLEMRFMDEELRPATAVRNARFLVTEWGAHFLYGVDSSGSAMALGPVLRELDRVHFFTHAATHRLTEELVAQQGIRQIVRVSAPVYQDAVAAWLFRDMRNVRRWATIGADYEYGYAAWALFREQMRRFRPDVQFVGAAWAPFLTQDFSSHIAAVMATNPDGIFATPWAGEAVTLLRQALLQGVFDRVQVWFQAMGGSVDVLEGIAQEVREGRFRGKLYATARYIHNWPNTEQNRSFVSRFAKRWNRMPNYSAETTYSAVYITKAAVERARSLRTDRVVDALRGLRIETPAGVRVFRAEDQQFVYTVPAGKVVADPRYPIPVLGELKVFDPREYWRWPPFQPLDLSK
ncbi:Leucine-, isoleucine-, valine-, threonine-, and alanine-binding protein [bacterium HR32]|nr:Leucine-, isoleucine-, valine-, threonine-, and alanine-binding protein [bacterium HR32]